MDKPIQILYIDELAADRRMVRESLRSAAGRFELCEVETPGQFAARLAEGVFDLALCGLNVPDPDELSIIEATRVHDASLPVLLAVATDAEETALEGLRRGAADYVVKAFPQLRRLPHALLAALKHRILEGERDRCDLQHRALFDRAPLAYQSLDREGRFLDINQTWQDILGYRRSEVLGNWFGDYLDPDEVESFREGFQRFLDSGEVQGVEFNLRHKDGGTRTIQFDGRITGVDDNGKLRTHCILHDITEQRRAEEDRRRLAAAIEQSSETVVITDPEGTILYANPAFERITGYTREEAVGQNPRVLKSGRHDEAFYKDLWETISGGEVWRGHFINKRKDERLYEEEAAISPVFDAAGEICNYVAVKRDVTHEIELENQLRQAQKMEAVGQLAGGVAHDFNNILQAMFGYIRFAMRDLSPDEQRYRDIEQIKQGTERASTLTRQLLAFSRRQIIQPENLEIGPLVDNLLKLVRRVIGEDVALEFHAAEDLPAIHADPTQIEQVLMNLCLNARDAMPEGGRLSIETAAAVLDDEFRRLHPWARTGSFVLVSVSDTGQGMDEETRARVFEPFFTTKEPGRGTGLGLSTVYGIVKQHEGLLHVSSRPGRGSTFRVYLPAADSPAEKPAERSPEERRGRGETILVAEDDVQVREMVARTLREAGYRVHAAEDGAEALEIFSAHSQEIALALLDVVMPGMGGTEVYERMRALKPSLRVLFSSGYTDDFIHSRTLLRGELRLIAKPFDPLRLLGRVREMLDG